MHYTFPSVHLLSKSSIFRLHEVDILEQSQLLCLLALRYCLYHTQLLRAAAASTESCGAQGLRRFCFCERSSLCLFCRTLLDSKLLRSKLVKPFRSKKTHINKYLRKRYTKKGRHVQTVRASKLFLKYAHLALSGAASLSCASLCTRSTLLLSQSCACAKPYKPLHQHTVARNERLRAQHQRLVAEYDSRAVRRWPVGSVAIQGWWTSRHWCCRAP